MNIKKYSEEFEEKWEKLRWGVLRIPKASAWEVWQSRGKSDIAVVQKSDAISRDEVVKSIHAMDKCA